MFHPEVTLYGRWDVKTLCLNAAMETLKHYAATGTLKTLCSWGDIKTLCLNAAMETLKHHAAMETLKTLCSWGDLKTLCSCEDVKSPT